MKIKYFHININRERGIHFERLKSAPSLSTFKMATPPIVWYGIKMLHFHAVWRGDWLRSYGTWLVHLGLVFSMQMTHWLAWAWRSTLGIVWRYINDEKSFEGLPIKDHRGQTNLKNQEERRKLAKGKVLQLLRTGTLGEREAYAAQVQWFLRRQVKYRLDGSVYIYGDSYIDSYPSDAPFACLVQVLDDIQEWMDKCSCNSGESTKNFGTGRKPWAWGYGHRVTDPFPEIHLKAGLLKLTTGWCWTIDTLEFDVCQFSVDFATQIRELSQKWDVILSILMKN